MALPFVIPSKGRDVGCANEKNNYVSEVTLAYVAFCTIMAISRQKGNTTLVELFRGFSILHISIASLCTSQTFEHFKCLPMQQTQNIFRTFIQRRTNVFDVGPTLYKSSKNVCVCWACTTSMTNIYDPVGYHEF